MTLTAFIAWISLLFGIADFDPVRAEGASKPGAAEFPFPPPPPQISNGF